MARTVRELWRVNLALGFPQRMGYDGATPRTAGQGGRGQLGESQVRAWLSGQVMPTTSQALAVLDALPLPRVGAAELNGAK